MEVAFSLFCLGGCVLSIAAFVVIIALLARHNRAVYQRKVAALHGWARTHGWQYWERDPNLPNAFRGEPFGRGSGRTALHVMSAEHRGRGVLGFEYQFTVSNGDNGSRTYRYTVVTVSTPAPRPYLQLSREHGGHRLLELVGIRDLQLESEEFNRAFRIHTGDDRFAYAVLDPRMMEWLLADARTRVPFRLENQSALCWMSGEIDPRNVLWMADFLIDFLERVPDFVWK